MLYNFLPKCFLSQLKFTETFFKVLQTFTPLPIYVILKFPPNTSFIAWWIQPVLLHLLRRFITNKQHFSYLSSSWFQLKDTEHLIGRNQTALVREANRNCTNYIYLLSINQSESTTQKQRWPVPIWASAVETHTSLVDQPTVAVAITITKSLRHSEIGF